MCNFIVVQTFPTANAVSDSRREYGIQFHGELIPHLFFGSKSAAEAWLNKYKLLLDGVAKIQKEYEGTRHS